MARSLNYFKCKYTLNIIVVVAIIVFVFLFSKTERWFINESIQNEVFIASKASSFSSTKSNFLQQPGKPFTTLPEYEIDSENLVATLTSSSLKAQPPSVSSTKLYPKQCKQSKEYSPRDLNETYEEAVIRRHPNLPEFLITSRRFNKLIPHLTKIRWSGTVYQESWKEHPKCFLYSANFDARLKTGLIVRLLSLCEDKIVDPNFYCQFRYSEIDISAVSPVYEAYFPESFNGIYGPLKVEPIMMSCQVPLIQKDHKIPIAVSIVKKPCTIPTNIMKIGGSPYKKEDKESINKKDNITIGLCGKALYYYNEDFSVRLVEWIELWRILGISRFFLYKTPCHINVEKVLDYYEEKGIVKILSYHYPSPHVQEPTLLRLWIKNNLAEFRAGQRIFYNDCILRNKDGFDYLAIFDYDEIPILGKHKNLPGLMRHVKKLAEMASNITIGAFGLPWKTFYSNLEPGPRAANISAQFHILRHNRRTLLDVILKSEGNIKSIYDTSKTLYVSSHRSLKHDSIFPISDITLVLPRTLAYTGHFTEKICSAECEENQIEEENTLLLYENRIARQMNTILNEIHLNS